jgi:hypothetical protein
MRRSLVPQTELLPVGMLQLEQTHSFCARVGFLCADLACWRSVSSVGPRNTGLKGRKPVRSGMT